ncbi:MAG: response regulator [Gammaproteobacteria bacterium]
MRNRPLRPPYRVILVEDHKFLAEILAQRLSLDPSLKIMGIANDGAAALHLVKTQPVDIALLDIQLEQEDGLGVASRLWEVRPELRVIGLSRMDGDYHAGALIELGARGFLTKRSNTKDILEAIRRVANGDLAISPQIAVHLALNASQVSPTDLRHVLTQKELEVLTEIARGLSVKQIALKLGLTEKTIQTHRNSIRKKLNATTDVQLCLLAIKAGLVDIHQVAV